MPKWCFKCRGLVDAVDGACATCGARIADAVDGAGLTKPKPLPGAGALGFVSESKLVQFLSKQYGVPEINLAEWEISSDVLALVPKDLARRLCLIPVTRGAGSSISIAMADPSDTAAINEIRERTGLEVHVSVASDKSIAHAINTRYDQDGR